MLIKHYTMRALCNDGNFLWREMKGEKIVILEGVLVEARSSQDIIHTSVIKRFLITIRGGAEKSDQGHRHPLRPRNFLPYAL